MSHDSTSSTGRTIHAIHVRTVVVPDIRVQVHRFASPPHPPATHKRSYPNPRPPRTAALSRQVAISIRVPEQERRGQQSPDPQDRVAGHQSCLRDTARIPGAVPRDKAVAAGANAVDRWIAAAVGVVGDADPVASPKRVPAAENALDRHSLPTTRQRMTLLS